MKSPKYRKTKQRSTILEKLQEHLSKGQTWAAFYDNEFRVAKKLAELNIIEYDSLTGVFNLPGTCVPEPPDCPCRE